MFIGNLTDNEKIQALRDAFDNYYIDQYGYDEEEDGEYGSEEYDIED